jgi:CRISPR-associated protein Csx17
MGELALTGCRAIALSGYLSALGVHRAVARTLDTEAEGYWRHGTYILRCRFSTLNELAAAMHSAFRPESIVAPWNSGSGFKSSGTRPTADRAVQWIRDSTDERLEPLRRAVAEADRLVTKCRRLGIDPWDEKRKSRVIQLWRNELPDAAITWLDAAIALGQDGDPSYSPLLGTGGNLGSQELSATYLQQVRKVLESRDSVKWLTSALDGQQRAPLPRDSPGQFDPGGVGASEEPNRVGNPWTFLFVIEGTLLFATAVVRRYSGAYSKAALPFQVRGSTTAGFDSAAPGEHPRAELWAPEWSEPMRIRDIAHLYGEGRADWNSHTARSGLDMARAAATLGVDRGVIAFHRHVFVDRLGQSPMAVPAGRIEVGVRAGVDLLAPLDRWREALRDSDPPPHTAARLRALDQAVFGHACSGAASALAEVFAALGRCRSAASRSSKARAADLPHLSFPNGVKLFSQLRGALEGDRELRIALALASAHDKTTSFQAWLKDSVLAAGLAASLADIARRRGFPLATETVTEPMASVRGARILFQHGMRLRSADVAAFIDGTVDDERTAALAIGLSCIDWQHARSENLPGAMSLPDPGLDLLLLFTSAAPLGYTDTEGQPASLLVRPGHEWPGQLIAGHIPEVLRDACTSPACDTS